MSTPAITVERIGKRYQIGRREQYRALRDRVSALWKSPQGSRHTGPAPSIWALKDVSLEVKPGEVLGVIGPNGAGKTTLLRILSRITRPTEGRAVIRGRVGSLLEVGTGFHPELTGRENIYLNGAILGMRRAEISKCFDAIVEFSGVETFIDTPVKHYSSGMYVRLAFSVAAHFEPEILLVDEVLAVGDAAFQERCLGKMSQVVRGGRTILFVSHNMTAVRSLCSRAVLLSGGTMQMDGRVDAVIQYYLSGLHPVQATAQVSLAQRTDRRGSGRVRAASLEVRSAEPDIPVPATGADMEFIVGYASADRQPVIRLQVVLAVSDLSGNNIFGCTTRSTSRGYFWSMPPEGKVACRVKGLPLVPGEYMVSVQIKDDQPGVTDEVERAISFRVIDAGKSGLDLAHSKNHGPVIVQQEWTDMEALTVPREESA